jgi:hypothetical protein
VVLSPRPAAASGTPLSPAPRPRAASINRIRSPRQELSTVLTGPVPKVSVVNFIKVTEGRALVPEGVLSVDPEAQLGAGPQQFVVVIRW